MTGWYCQNLGIKGCWDGKHLGCALIEYKFCPSKPIMKVGYGMVLTIYYNTLS